MAKAKAKAPTRKQELEALYQGKAVSYALSKEETAAYVKKNTAAVLEKEKASAQED